MSIPGYRILSEIHRGGQGVVYKAIRQSTGQTVAVKVLRWPSLAKPEERSRFAREVDVLGTLRHPNIVRLNDGGTIDDCCYFVMDFVDGQPLAEWVGRERHVVPDTLRVFVKLCSAVEAAHRRGIIHRDLKPSNILIDRDDEPFVVDFGLAKIVSEEDFVADDMTSTGQFIGSVPWASPEQAEGRRDDVDSTTDVYGLGSLLYYMLTGRAPFRIFGSIRDMLDIIISEDPEKPTSVRGDLGAELDTIILKSISKEQSRRYQTVRELRQDVERYLSHEPIEARRNSTWYVLTKTVRRHRAVATMSSLLFVATVFYAGTMTVMFRRARLAEQAAEHDSAAATAQFAIARDAVHFLIDEVDDRLDGAGRTQPARREILQGASDYLDRLSTIRGDSPALMRARARARTRLGKIDLSVGDVGEARPHFLAASNERKTLAANRSSTPLDDAQWSLSLVRIGDCRTVSGELELAKRYYDRAYEIDRRLLADHPDNIHFLDNLVWSHERLGDNAWKRGEHELARKHFQLQVTLADRLIQRGVTRGSLWAKACSVGQLEALAAHETDHQLSYNLCEQRVKLLDRLVDVAPNDRGYRRMRAAVYAIFSARAMRLGKIGLALHYAKYATQLARSQLSEYPDDLATQLTFTKTMLALGGLRRSDELLDLHEARSAFKEALEIAAMSTRAAPHHRRAWAQRFHLLCGLAAVSADLDDPQEAERLYVQAFALADDIRNRRFVTPSSLKDFADCLIRSVRSTLGGTEAALVANEKYAALIGPRSP